KPVPDRLAQLCLDNFTELLLQNNKPSTLKLVKGMEIEALRAITRRPGRVSFRVTKTKEDDIREQFNLMSSLLEAKKVFEKDNAEGEKWEKNNPNDTEFTDQLFNTPSSSFAPSPPREPTPPRDLSKGKGVATKEPMKELIPYIDEGGSNLKMLNVKSFVTPESVLSQEDLMAQLKEMKRLVNLKTKKEEYEKSLWKMMNPATDATIRITRDHDSLNVRVYNKSRLKTLIFSEWLKVYALASKTSSKSNDLIFQSLRANFNWIITQAKKLGLPPPPELAHFGRPAPKKKRKRTSKILKEVFVTEDIKVDGMYRNLIPPQGFVGSRGLVITKPESGIFYYNGNFDLVFQRENELHLSTTA
nr:hypothetical protein [Tanacetum cinerariifolium]